MENQKQAALAFQRLSKSLRATLGEFPEYKGTDTKGALAHLEQSIDKHTKIMIREIQRNIPPRTSDARIYIQQLQKDYEGFLIDNIRPGLSIEEITHSTLICKQAFEVLVFLNTTLKTLDK